MMRIIVDSREQRPYSFRGYDIEIITGALPVGDYSIPGFEDRAAIERKSINDLIGCLMGKNRERFERELTKGRYYELFAVVVEASWQDIAKGRYRSAMKQRAAAQSLICFQVRHRVPFLFMGSRAASQYATYSLLEKYSTEIQKRCNKLCKNQ